MPDRDDSTQYAYTNESGAFADFPTGIPDGAPQTQHENFPHVFQEQMEDADVLHDFPRSDVMAENPQEFYTAFRVDEQLMSVAFPLLGGSSLIQSGAQILTGFSCYYPGGTGPILLRDGLDASSPVVAVLPPAQYANGWFGMDGPRFKFGIYVDLSAAGPITAAYGAVYLAKKFAI